MSERRSAAHRKARGLMPPPAERVTPHDLVTGTICAVSGVVDDNGAMVVSEVHFPGALDRDSPRERNSEEAGMMKRAHLNGVTSGVGPCVLIVGGFDLSSGEGRMEMQMLVDYVQGYNVDASDCGEIDASNPGNICCVIIAGGVFGMPDAESEVVKSASSTAAGDAIKAADDFISQLCMHVPVHLIPGPLDPTNAMLPQMPIHPCMLRESMTYDSLVNCANPYSCRIGGCAFLGTTGAPIKDLVDKTCRVVNGEKVKVDDLTAIEMCLRMRHIAPTAPDSLPCHPFTTSDPFCIKDVPQCVFTCGSSDKFETRTTEGGVRIIAVPEFKKRKIGAIVELDNMECWSVKFG